MLFSALPHAQGLYDPERETDSCGVAMITDIQGRRSHAIVADGLVALEHLDHRGAAGAETNSGDGAGILHPAAGRALPRRGRLRASRADRRRQQRVRRRNLLPAAGYRRTVRPRASRSRRSRTRKVWRSSAGARYRSTRRRRSRCHRARLHAVHGTVFRDRARTRSARRHRPRPPGLPAAQEGRGGQRLLPVAVQPDDRLQGHADDDAAAAVLSGSAGRTLY